MKTTLAALFTLSLLQALAFGGIDADIPQTNQVILALGGSWKPSAEEAQKALVAIQAFLDNPSPTNEYTAGKIKKILANTQHYRVQFVGMELDGKNLISCNFIPEAPIEGKDDNEHWKEHPIGVFDGGFRYWHICYDPLTGKCTSISFH